MLANNVFVERVLPGSTLKGISDEAMEVYRRPYLEPGESRRPTLSWPRDIPIDGEPADVVAIVDEYAAWLSESEIPKLFINAGAGRHPDRGTTGVLPVMAQPEGGNRGRSSLHPGRLAPGDWGGDCGVARQPWLAFTPLSPGRMAAC